MSPPFVDAGRPALAVSIYAIRLSVLTFPVSTYKTIAPIVDPPATVVHVGFAESNVPFVTDFVPRVCAVPTSFAEIEDLNW